MEAQIAIRIPVVVFKDEDEKVWYAHCPALDITGYGKSEDDAKASFEIVLQETVEYMISHGTLEKELRRMGWKKSQGRPTPPPMETLLRKNEELRRMMSLQHSLTYSPVPAIQ
jgi:predicted RNase H-like HicB family nuclease